MKLPLKDQVKIFFPLNSVKWVSKRLVRCSASVTIELESDHSGGAKSTLPICVPPMAAYALHAKLGFHDHLFGS
jgi:hypothetical protein